MHNGHVDDKVWSRGVNKAGADNVEARVMEAEGLQPPRRHKLM